MKYTSVERTATTHVLVVDADAETRRDYGHSFALAGCRVVEASDGRDALVKAFLRPPDLVVTELELPLIDGYALCEILRRDRTTANAPILVVTTETRPAQLEKARAAGADAVFVKPTATEILLNELRRLVTGSNELHGRSTARATAADQLRRSAELLSRPPKNRSATLVREHRRFKTTAPPMTAPDLNCPACDGPLKYEWSHIGGVSDRHSEQWDYLVCPSCCGSFQYRHRTRKVRRVA